MRLRLNEYDKGLIKLRLKFVLIFIKVIFYSIVFNKYFVLILELYVFFS